MSYHDSSQRCSQGLLQRCPSPRHSPPHPLFARARSGSDFALAPTCVETLCNPCSQLLSKPLHAYCIKLWTGLDLRWCARGVREVSGRRISRLHRRLHTTCEGRASNVRVDTIPELSHYEVPVARRNAVEFLVVAKVFASPLRLQARADVAHDCNLITSRVGSRKDRRAQAKRLTNSAHLRVWRQYRCLFALPYDRRFARPLIGLAHLIAFWFTNPEARRCL